MSRIKLKELLNLTEQAPQPPPAPPTAGANPAGQPPAPAPAAPPTATPEAPTTEPTGPSPEDPGEYDFTKDFKVFESSIEKAKQAAKKKFLDRMNQFVQGKKVTVNASRGYGQPQKDYTIDKVSKASVDWYYNKNVVVLSDENGKEYFLTPGVNVKIEQAAPAEPEAPEEPPKAAKPAPKPTPGGQPGQPPAPGGQGEEPAAGGPEAQSGQPGQEQPATPGETPAQKPGLPNPEEDPELAKKKKMAAPPVKEEDMGFDANKPTGDTGFGDASSTSRKPYNKEQANRDFYEVFRNLIPLQPGQSNIDLRPYFVSGYYEGDGESWSSEVKFKIPSAILGTNFSPREFQLDYKDEARHYSGPGQAFSRGSVDIERVGRYYEFTFSDNGGLDI